MLMVVVALAVATAVVSAHAQSSKVVADIPFEFSVGFMMMPAGEYSAEIQTNANNALMIRSADGRLNAVRLSQETDRAKNNKTYARFVFHRYGERYFLYTVHLGVNEQALLDFIQRYDVRYFLLTWDEFNHRIGTMPRLRAEGWRILFADQKAVLLGKQAS